MPELECQQCGKKFIRKCRGKQKFCSARCREKYRNSRKSDLEQLETTVKVGAGSSIGEIDRLAREAHMTYGQYVAVRKI